MSFEALGTPHRPFATLISKVDGFIAMLYINFDHRDMENLISVPIGKTTYKLEINTDFVLNNIKVKLVFIFKVFFHNK